MEKIATVGIDLAKTVFQIHAIDAAGTVVVSKAVRRGGFLEFMSRFPTCLIGMEACASAHHWARELWFKTI
jgi:transposase